MKDHKKLVQVATEVGVALEPYLHQGSHRFDLRQSGIALAFKSILLAIL